MSAVPSYLVSHSLIHSLSYALPVSDTSLLWHEVYFHKHPHLRPGSQSICNSLIDKREVLCLLHSQRSFRRCDQVELATIGYFRVCLHFLEVGKEGRGGRKTTGSVLSSLLLFSSLQQKNLQILVAEVHLVLYNYWLCGEIVFLEVSVHLVSLVCCPWCSVLVTMTGCCSAHSQATVSPGLKS